MSDRDGPPSAPKVEDSSFADPDSPQSSQSDLLQNGKRRYAVRLATEDDGQDLTKDILLWAKKHKSEMIENAKHRTAYDWLTVFIPMFKWLRTYDVKSNLWLDLCAGASVAAMVIPQGMSYAKLAGLPSVYGLYGAFVPVLFYVALGSSRQLAVGPVAVTSLLLGTGIPKLIDVAIQDDPNTPTDPGAQDEYNHAAIQVAFLAGLLYTTVGLLRLGWITNFLSHSVINGFITGASVIIGLSQAKFLFGYNKVPNPAYLSTKNKALPKTINFPRNDPVWEQLRDLFSPDWLPYFKWREFLMGACWIVMLLTMKKLGQRHKKLRWMRAIGPLSVTILSIAITNIFHLYKAPHAIRVVGAIPKGLPGPSVNLWFPLTNFGQKLGLAVIVCLIDILESMSIAKALAYRNKYVLDATQELRGLGLANLAGSAFHCYTTTGSFSRSAINNDCGARTQVSGITNGLLVMITLLVLTPVFKNMPQNAQGAIVISAVIGLFNYSEFMFLWKVNKFDWLVFTVSALAVMLAGVEIGLAISIGLSIVIVLLKTAFPHTAVLGRLPGTTIYRSVKQYPEAEVLPPSMLLVRIDAAIYFANVGPIQDTLARYEERAATAAERAGSRLRFVILDLAPVTDIDATAVHFLKEWVNDKKERNIQPVFANPGRQVVRLLEAAKIIKQIGEDFVCVRTHDAVAVCQEVLARERDDKKLEEAA